MTGTSALRPGDPGQVGPYRLTHRIGEGGQGAVFLGTAPSGEIVAVKLLHARFSGDAKARTRFAAEVATAQRVAPFCTAGVLDADVSGHIPYIVSEYIDAPSLNEVVTAQGPREGPALDRLAIGTITALAAIHQAGIVHRDFKPSNVLMAQDGPRVIDFGIARALDATGTLSSTAVGTPAYMAPEQISGEAVGPPADVFAWGSTMVYAASGSPAHGWDSIPAVMHRILNAPPDLGPLTGPLRELVARCLAKDPAARPDTQQVLIRLLSDAGALPRPESVLSRGAQAAAPMLVPPVPAPASWTPPPPGPAPVADGTDPLPPGTAPRRRTARRRVPAVAAALGVILVGSVVAVKLSGAPDPAVPPAGKLGGTLHMALAPPAHLDPSQAVYGSDLTIVKQLFTGLTETGTDGSVYKRLATSVTPDPTCRTWKISLRSGTTFSDGEPVDAAAFLRGWNRAAQAGGSASVLLHDIAGFGEVTAGRSAAMSGARAGAGGALEVSLTGPDCEFDRRLAGPVFYPVPKSAGRYDNAVYNNRPVGNGPFTVGVYQPGRRLTLLRNDSWAFPKARLDSVTVDLTTDAATTGLAGFATGLQDWAVLDAGSAPTAVAQHRSDGELFERNVYGMQFLQALTVRGPMKSLQARLAVSYALNRPELTSVLYDGTRTPATGFVPAALPGFGTGGRCLSCVAYDTGKATSYARQADLPPGSAVTIAASGTTAGAMAAVQSRLQSVLGWKVTIDTQQDYSTLDAKLSAPAATGLAGYAWFADYPSAGEYLATFFGSASTANHTGWHNARFDQLLAQAKASPDATTRVQLVQQAEQLVLADLPVIPLWNYAEVRLANTKRFTGLAQDYDGDPTLATAALRG